MRKKFHNGFIDRTPLRFIGGLFIFIIGLFTKSLPLSLLGIFDLIVSFLFFLNPDIEYNKTFKLPVLLMYGGILVWCILWLMSKLP